GDLGNRDAAWPRPRGHQGSNGCRARAGGVCREPRRDGGPRTARRGAGLPRPALWLAGRPLGQHLRLDREVRCLRRRPYRARPCAFGAAAWPVVRLAAASYRFALALAGSAHGEQRPGGGRGGAAARLARELAVDELEPVLPPEDLAVDHEGGRAE